MNNTSGRQLMSAWTVVLVCVVCGCQPAKAPPAATTVLTEEQVKVRVDAQGKVQSASAPVAPAPLAEAK